MASGNKSSKIMSFSKGIFFVKNISKTLLVYYLVTHSVLAYAPARLVTRYSSCKLNKSITIEKPSHLLICLVVLVIVAPAGLITQFTD